MDPKPDYIFYTVSANLTTYRNKTVNFYFYLLSTRARSL